MRKTKTFPILVAVFLAATLLVTPASAHTVAIYPTGQTSGVTGTMDHDDTVALDLYIYNVGSVDLNAIILAIEYDTRCLQLYPDSAAGFLSYQVRTNQERTSTWNGVPDNTFAPAFNTNYLQDNRDLLCNTADSPANPFFERFSVQSFDFGANPDADGVFARVTFRSVGTGTSTIRWVMNSSPDANYRCFLNGLSPTATTEFTITADTPALSHFTITAASTTVISGETEQFALTAFTVKGKQALLFNGYVALSSDSLTFSDTLFGPFVSGVYTGTAVITVLESGTATIQVQNTAGTEVGTTTINAAYAPPVPPNEDDDNCFIATAGFGRDHWILSELHHFRDEILLSSCLGRGCVAAYYQYGPQAASLITSDLDRTLARAVLMPAVVIAVFMNHAGVILLLFLSAFGLSRLRL